MGNRANLVIVKDQDWQLYYSHWAGCRILDALIGGPELALRYIQSLRRCGKDEWTDPLWADGGAVVDLDRRRLLFFGDELMVDMAERRAVMTVLAAIWPAYEIGWAYDGTVELAGYVGAELRCHTSGTEAPVELEQQNRLCHLVSVVDDTGKVRMWPLQWDVSPAWHGPGLIRKLPGRGVRSLTRSRIPLGGVHIDIARKTLGAWQTADAMGVFKALPGLWSGWQTECWEDRFEEQALRCGRALRLPELDLAAGMDSLQAWIRRRVFQSFADSPAGHIAEIANLLAPIEPGLAVSDDALTNDGVRPTEAEWAAFVAACDLLRVDRAQSA
ncbi:hypothetical protein OQ968_20115 [Mycobacterium sp. 663a-19]|uniref:hypothetical protein n=1 Tax=Mycobacterium sp. 663a-19 TaxID=2986148 RepID=UPI002D1EA9A2|nr:hypothetical protein [Mycobacterium sp. 663a-19]MEB3983560.1 hypothetical protein [Mycobacterium sp. 663a-19]